MKLIAKTKLDNGEIAYTSDPQKLYEVKEKLYRYERVADEPEKVVAIDTVLEIIDRQQIIANHGNAVDAGINSACNYIRAEVERLKGEQGGIQSESRKI